MADTPKPDASIGRIRVTWPIHTGQGVPIANMVSVSSSGVAPGSLYMLEFGVMFPAGLGGRTIEEVGDRLSASEVNVVSRVFVPRASLVELRDFINGRLESEAGPQG